MMKQTFLAVTALSLATAPASAADKAKDALPTISKCATSFGSIALADGDSQGWTELGLGSPRELLAAIVAESGCFTMHSASSGAPATFLMSAVAGASEAVDQGIGVARAGAIQGLARSGALGRLGGFGGMGGKALGMLGGMGGKKKTISAGLRVLSPATGQTVAYGSAESVKTSLTLGGEGGWGFANSAVRGVSQYTSSKDGIQLATAFINAYNAVTQQSGALSSVPKPVLAVAIIATAIDTQLYAQASKGTIVRALRAGTQLTPTGKRDGMFAEVKDSFGTQGWVAVEDMK
jgi:hypothetical protein